jgi:hypothetical protein
MSDVIVRGNLLTVIASPLDGDGNPVAPASVELYLTYMDSTGAESTHGPISMISSNTAGTTWTGSFDTSLAMEGPLFGSVRASNPSAAADFKRRLVANPANPDPTP